VDVHLLGASVAVLRLRPLEGLKLALVQRIANIALIPGDGTGPEVLAEGVKVLNAACAKHGIKLNYQSFDCGGERYKRTGEILPDSALEEFKKYDSIFLGAIGHPDVKPGILEVGILLKTRFALDQYINLRPVKLYPNVETPLKDKGPEHIDFVVVRENTGGIYIGVGGVTQKGTPLEVATQVMPYSRPVVGSRGEPPSSARRVPSREGMETLPGFPS